jgi:ligand-binding sensor domain-containing protein
LFAGTKGGVFRSFDKGETWVSVNEGLVDKNKQAWENHVNHLCFNPQKNHLYAATYSTIFKSIDNGNSWSATGFHGIKYTSGLLINKDEIVFTGVLGFSPTEGVYYSLNGGKTWTKINKGESVSNIQSLTIDSYGYLYAGTIIGLYRTDKPTTR